MINVEVRCIRKTENYDEVSAGTVSEVSFQPIAASQYGMGAAIGTPNSGVSNLTEPVKPLYNLLSSFTVTIADAEIAAGYTVGESYSLTVGKLSVKKDK